MRRVHTRPSSTATPSPAAAQARAVKHAAASRGQPLGHSARPALEARFGHDFSKVTIHADNAADRAAAAAHAKAMAIGSHVFFADGKYDPKTSEGLELLHHELTHVVQYEGNPAFDLSTLPLMSRPGDASEREASQAADQLGSGSGNVSVGASLSAAISCDPVDDWGPPTQPQGGPEPIPATDPMPGIPPTQAGPGAPGFVPESQVPTVPGGGGTPGGGSWMGDPQYSYDPNATPEPPSAPEVPEIPEGPVSAIPDTLPSAGVDAGLGAEGAEAGLGAGAELGAGAALPVALAAAAGGALGYGMGSLADSSYTKTGAFGTNADTGQSQSAMDWGASWGTDWDKAHNNGDPSIMGGALAGAGGIVGGIGGAGYGAYNWLKGKL